MSTDLPKAAFEAVEKGDYEGAKNLLIPLAQDGHIYAMKLLGWIYGHTKVEGADKKAGARWYRRAAEGGATEAFYYSGCLLLEVGEREGARDAFEQGVALGSMQAMYGLGHYLEVYGTTEERIVAIEWFEKAASRGHFPARRRLLSIAAADSFMGKVTFIPKLLKSTLEGVVLYWKDRNSEQLH
jgi:TPR repeat protein